MDLPLGDVVSLGPAVGFAWQGGEARVTVSLSVALSLNGERVGKPITIP